MSWVGAEAVPVEIAGRVYRLSWVWLGRTTDFGTTPAVDPSLPIGTPLQARPELPRQLLTYREWDEGTRARYLEWVERGRTDAEAATAFLLHFLFSLEIALLRDTNPQRVAAIRAELERVMQTYGEDAEFMGCAQSLLELCGWLQKERGPADFASAKTNHRGHMPFAARRYIGEALKQSPMLEADPALFFLLQQPGTRLDAHSAQGFVVIHHHWTQNYSHYFDGGIELKPTKLLSLDYECLDGVTRAQFASDVPDPASAPVPTELREFFDLCRAEWETARDLPAAQQVALIKQLGSTHCLRVAHDTPALRSDYQRRIGATLDGKAMVEVDAREVFSALFEGLTLPTKKRAPKPLCRQLEGALEDIGVGLEPDTRYGLPASLRPDSKVVLFREEPMPFEEPNDAFRLAHAAMVLSAIGVSNFRDLERLSVEDAEAFLPYRHRFTDREMRRLEASFHVMRKALQPRQLLANWAKRMKKSQRMSDLDVGFGIAFYKQAANPLVTRYATAVSKALHGDDRRVQRLLDELKRQAEIDLPVAEGDGIVRLDDYRSERSRCSVAGRGTAQPPIEGLPCGPGQILLALFERPRSRSELNEIARAQNVRLSPALEQLNEWSIATLNSHATCGHNTVRINPDVFDAIELLAKPS